MSKDKVTFTACLKKKYSTDKEGIVNIRITRNRASTYVSLKEKIRVNYWDFKRCKLKESYEDYERLAKLINDKILELKGHYGILKDVELVKEKSKSSYLTYLLDEVDYLEKMKSIGTSKRYRTAYFHLKEYLISRGKSDLLFSEIDPSFVRNYEAYFTHIGLRKNTIKNYVNCLRRLYNQAMKQGLVTPTINPFIFYVNHKEPVEKRRLSQVEFERIIKYKPEPDSTLFHTKSYFLFQVFSQGLRVGDLLTLRFKNINEGRLVFFQSKTKRPHTVLVNDNMVMILKDYIDVDTNKILNQRWRFKQSGEDYLLTYSELLLKYKEIQKQHLAGIIASGDLPKEIVSWKKTVDDVRFKLYSMILPVIQKYAKSNPDKFIFPILRDDDFAEVSFQGDSRLSKYQYNQISSKTALYNKNLKKLQSACEISTKLSSHISRHTYTDFMLMEDGIDVYDISKSLGHTRLATTEHYLREFSVDRVDDSNLKVNSRFSVL
jgi:site-specific recombinase XerD